VTEEVAGPQVEAAVTPVPTPSVAPAVLSMEQHAVLRAALNRIVPAGGDMPAAGDIDIGSFIERTLATTPRLRRLFLDGLAELAVAGFLQLSAMEQTRVLQQLELQKSAFFAALVEHTYRGYYTHPEVLARLSDAGPPQPRGRTLPPFDPKLLEKQRARAPFWRHT
jgi:Gluconate 2-dehydrogenase subunit 3